MYKYSNTTNAITSVTGGSDEFTLNLKETYRDIAVNDVIGVFDVTDVDGFYKVKSVAGDKITLINDTGDDIEDIESCVGYITNFVKVRANNVDDANKMSQ